VLTLYYIDREQCTVYEQAGTIIMCVKMSDGTEMAWSDKLKYLGV